MNKTTGLSPFDMHCHVGTWQTPDFCHRSTGLGDLTTLYERLGFAGALITTTDMADNTGLAHEIEAYSGPLDLRFAFWVLPANLNELNKLAGHVAALKIHPSFLRRPVSDPAFKPFLAMARSMGWPVVVHCGRWQEVAGFELALDTARQWPEVNFVLSHMGGDAPCLVHDTVDRIVRLGIKNVFLGTESIRQFDLVQYAVSRLGAARVVFGSDYNLNSPSAFVHVVLDAELTTEENELILYRNARDLLTQA